MSARVFHFLPPYSVSGETGKALGPARVSLESLDVTSASLDFRSLAPDLARWYQRGGTPPEYGQAISIWDAAGTRVFTGHCMDPEPEWTPAGIAGYSVTVQGPFWWLEQAQLTSLLTDDAATEAERPYFVFPAQDLAVSIRTLLDRMQALGVPLQCGEIDPTFEVVQMTMQGGSGASALRDMLDWIPDATTRVRYDVDGLPAIDILRRPTAPVVTLQLGSESDLTGAPKITRRRELRPTSVRVQSMEVNSTGQIIYSEQTAGDVSGASGAFGRQFVAVSGPGRSDFRSYTPRVATLQTVTVPTAISSIWALAVSLDQVIVDAVANFGAITWTAYGDYGGYPALPRGISGTGTYRLTSGTVIDFLKTEFSVTETSTRVAGWIFGKYPSSGYSSATGYLISIGRAFAGFVSPPSGGDYIQAIFVDFQVPTISQDCSTLTVFVHPQDQYLVTPVADLALNLYRAQGYDPYDGSVPLLPGSPIYLPGSSLNLRCAIPEWSTMRTPINAASIDLRRGSADLTLGSRSRLSGDSLIDRFSRASSTRLIRL